MDEVPVSGTLRGLWTSSACRRFLWSRLEVRGRKSIEQIQSGRWPRRDLRRLDRCLTSAAATAHRMRAD
jgi:hypothetical protein